MWELDHKEGWARKNWCFWTAVLKNTLECHLDCKQIKSLNPKQNQSWIYIGRTDTETEAPILWPPDVKSCLIWKDPDAGKDWGQEEKGVIQVKMVGWHHRLNGHEFVKTPGDSEGQGNLPYFSSWVAKSWVWFSDWTTNKSTEKLKWDVYSLFINSYWYWNTGPQIKIIPSSENTCAFVVQVHLIFNLLNLSPIVIQINMFFFPARTCAHQESGPTFLLLLLKTSTHNNTMGGGWCFLKHWKEKCLKRQRILNSNLHTFT